jgi:hypothetical protein
VKTAAAEAQSGHSGFAAQGVPPFDQEHESSGPCISFHNVKIRTFTATHSGQSGNVQSPGESPGIPVAKCVRSDLVAETSLDAGAFEGFRDALDRRSLPFNDSVIA